MTDFAAKAATQWQELLPEMVLNADEMKVAVRFSRLYQLQRSLDEKSLRRFEVDGVVGIDDFRLLALLRRSGEEGLTNADLVADLGGSKAGMSNRLDRLVQTGMIKRIPSLIDRRVHTNALTPEGQQRAAEAVTAVTAGRKTIFQDLSDTQIAHVATALETMIYNLNPDD